MKTLDLAFSYAKKIDVSGLDIYKDFKSIKDLHIKEPLAKYLSDKRNTKSNEFYRSVCFEAALIIHIDQTYRKPSCYDVAKVIIESHEGVLKTNYEKYQGTSYPKIMVDGWIKYLNDLKEVPLYLECSSGAIDLFFGIYSYLIDEK